MTEPAVVHSTFGFERVYPVAPPRVFAAWAEPEAKRRWFVDADGEDWETLAFEMDFRVGGRESGRFRHRGAVVHGNDTDYLDIVPDRRIIFTYSMSLDTARTSVSLGTVELLPAPSGTTLSYTEQAAYLDGLDRPEARSGGWNWLLDQLGIELDRTRR